MGEAHGNASVVDEPKTPMWLTALGAVLFLTAGLIWGLMPSAKDGPAGAAGADAGAAAPSR